MLLGLVSLVYVSFTESGTEREHLLVFFSLVYVSFTESDAARSCLSGLRQFH